MANGHQHPGISYPTDLKNIKKSFPQAQNDIKRPHPQALGALLTAAASPRPALGAAARRRARGGGAGGALGLRGVSAAALEGGSAADDEGGDERCGVGGLGDGFEGDKR